MLVACFLLVTFSKNPNFFCLNKLKGSEKNVNKCEIMNENTKIALENGVSVAWDSETNELSLLALTT